ncbi:sigma-70 family RNA polymerase sigma factor [Sphingobacterium yanglingense]|uniref:RNA polymerase sigma-70 factor (ECF subfamily) n=1 Tax=Sphingobacterium yanglingense TaxID=1437280 RepID=A0A4R6WK38_9SPHI|nr:sigma-70 family RNA polymerase sigma factor [Sphingobacterium yanglingense]TDQ75997.1 RNA polymerase sigma-70 factor (ECF subfamily) [Sphingobacterium yanglingense]
MTDLELWKLIKLDDEKAFSLLFNRYSSRIYSKAYSYLKSSETSEQIAHDIFITIWNNRKTLEIKSFNNYITAAARYRVYKHISLNKVIPIDYKENIEDFNSFESASNLGYSNLTYKDLEKEVDGYLDSLPKRCKEIFLLSRKYFLSNDEIAMKLGISKRTVENQITFALKHLRISLKDISIYLIILDGIYRIHQG